MRRKFFILCLIIQMGQLWAQGATGISGTVLDSKTQQVIPNVKVVIQNTNLLQLTTFDGAFLFSELTAGDYLLLFRSQGYKEALVQVIVIDNQILDLGIVLLEEDLITDLQTSVVRLFENDLSEDNSGSESTSGLLQSSKDAFQQAAAFNWGQARFRIRGLDSSLATTMINGVVMNKLYDGRPQWSNWGGLNDATRNQEFSIGTAPSDYTFGGILGTQEINTRASIYRPGTRISFSGTNTSYDWRTMATLASGMDAQGWAYVISAGKRWATEGYFEGTSFDGNSLFFSVEKKLNEQHSLNISAFYTPSSRGKNSPNTTEVTELTNFKYNSYWGFQGGKKRNSRIKEVEEPIVMLNHYFKINDETNLNTSISYQFGKISNSNLDYQNANSPDPSYYRKLPSYYSSLYAKDEGENSGAFTPDYENAEKSRLAFLTNPQIDWEALYRANQTAVIDNNGTITGYAPAKSHYVTYEDRTDDQTLKVNSVFNTQLSETLVLNAGGSYQNLKSHNYQKLIDLLGGSYFEDIDGFYSGAQAQSDVNNPNRQVLEGEAYGYNYKYGVSSFDAFSQFKFSFPKTDFYLAQTFSTTNYQRDGLYKNGIYQTNSFGKSERVKFENFGFKAGVTYKFSGRQLLTFNAAHLTKPPTVRTVFPNARLNNAVVDGLQSETINSADATYIFRSSKLKTRFTLYYSNIKEATQTSFFYAEGIFDNGPGFTSANAFVSQTLTHLNKKNIGAELSLEYQLSATMKTSFAVAYGQYVYDSNPQVSINNDALVSESNNNPSFDFGTALLKNYKQAGMPQQAYSLGLEYRDPSYWFIGSNINFVADNYLDFSPILRTSRFYANPVNGLAFPEATQERGDELLKQEKLESVFLLNFTMGKSWRIKAKNIGLFVSLNNVLNTKYRTGGYEQARNANFRQLNQDVSSGTPSFGNKYFYSYGRTFFANLYINL